MPTNVSPEYKKAEAEYRKARDPALRLQCLKEMLSTIPKHKGTEHLQADIKSRIKELMEELAGPRKGGARTGPVHTVRPEGAGQVALVGPPNSGKSSLHRLLTGSQAEIGPYPGSTQAPLPGMLNYEDVQFQLVDLPPVSAEFMMPWMPNALQPASAALLVVDLTVPGCVENVVAIRERLDARRITLTDDWGGRLGRGWLGDAADHDATPARAAGPVVPAQAGDEDEALALEDPFRILLPTLLVANKRDLSFEPDEVTVLEELVGAAWPAIAVSARTGSGLDRLGRLLFHGLAIVRVYTKIPGKPPDMGRPYTLAEGGTVLDVASLIHRDIAASLKYARIWGSGKFDGQQVGREHPVRDGDVLELHA
jgi:ribosome-interacting GTPase 1